jgi:hypothetical protein
MPKLAINYNNAVIYKIVCNDLTVTDCYVGSTTNFVKRKHQHKNCCKTKDFKIYQFIRTNGDWINWSMILVEEFPTTSNLLLEQRERYWIETLGSTLNCVIPTRTTKEYQKQYCDQKKENDKIYRDQNKDKIVQYQKIYREQNKDKIKENDKIFRDQNKDKIAEYQKQYYDQKKNNL